MKPQDALNRFRGYVRNSPRLRRAIMLGLGPLVPAVARIVQSGDEASFRNWRRVRLLRGRGFAPPGPDVPPLYLSIGEGAGAARSRASLAAQTDPAWREGSREEAAAANALWMELPAGATLVPHAVARLRAALTDPEARLAFGDEARRAPGGWVRDPWFKTAFDPDRMLQQDALGRCVAFRARLLPPGVAGNHALSLALCGEALRGGASGARRVPDLLLIRPWGDKAPWRTGYDAAAVRAFLERDGRGARLHPGPAPRIAWPLPDPAPLASVIVPTRDRAELLRPCIEGLLHRTDYPALEVVIADNGTREPDALALLAELARDPRVRVLDCAGPFNYSRINNQAVAFSRGEVLLLLNNDTEVRHPSWLREMVALAMREEIGVVGARLLFPDGRLQHQGVTLGLGGVAGHDMLFSPGAAAGPEEMLRVTRSVSAATAACLATRRTVFEQVGGLDETAFVVAYNDVDFCIRVREAGYRNLVTPHAELLHKESASRGDDMSPAHRERWERECRAMIGRWGDALRTDPFWHPVLTLDRVGRHIARDALRREPSVAGDPR